MTRHQLDVLLALVAELRKCVETIETVLAVPAEAWTDEETDDERRTRLHVVH